MATEPIEQQHQATKRLMQAYFDVAQEVLFSLDSNFKFQSLNQYTQQKLHFDIEVLKNTFLYDLAGSDSERRFIQQRLKAFKHSKLLHFQFTMRWSLPAGNTFEMAIQLSKFDKQFIGSAKDLSDTLHTLNELYEYQANFETLIEHNLTGILITDQDGVVIYANRAAATLMHQSIEDLVGFTLGHIQPMQAGEKFEIDFLRPGLTPGRAEISSLRTTWKEQPASLIIMHDITDLHEAHKRIEEMAYFDSLTKLPNRAFFMQMLIKTIYRYQRHGDGFSLFYMDLNDFKAVNDTYGHSAGDQLLNQVGERLRSTLRDEDLLARMGGDEFTAIVEKMTNPADLKNLALKIQNIFKQPMLVAGHEMVIRLSIGIATYPKDAKSADNLLSRADMAMYIQCKKP